MAKNNFSTAMDTARVGACFMVVMLHVAAMGFSSFDGQWWASNFYDSLVRSCVPIFLMISGVLLLGKREALREFFKKRFVRILPPLIFWSLFYMAWNTWQGKDYGGWTDWVRKVASGPVTFHLWYLYAIVGIYLFVPFLRNIWSASQRAEKRTYLALWALVSALPTVQAALNLNIDVLKTYRLGSFFGLAGYLFLGAYVCETYEQKTDKTRYWWINVCLFLIFSVLIMLATYAYSKRAGAPNPLFYDYLSPLVLASSICVFNILYGLGTKVGEYAESLKQVSACTLGIYCIHVFVLDRIETMAEGWDDAGISSWWSIPLTALCVFGVSLGAIMLLRKIRPFEFVT